jgi:hypothetical protein
LPAQFVQFIIRDVVAFAFLGREVEALKAAGCEWIFSQQISGKTTSTACPCAGATEKSHPVSTKFYFSAR